MFPLLFALAGCSTSSGGNSVDAAADVTEETGARDTGKDGPDLDAGADVGKAAPGVGFVACGASQCAIPGEVCCPRVDGGACFPRGAAPCSGIECDQPDDCADGTTCCYQFPAGCADVSATCKKTCGAADVPACLGLTDCNACVSLTCAGVPLTTCGTDGLCCH